MRLLNDGMASVFWVLSHFSDYSCDKYFLWIFNPQLTSNKMNSFVLVFMVGAMFASVSVISVCEKKRKDFFVHRIQKNFPNIIYGFFFSKYRPIRNWEKQFERAKSNFPKVKLVLYLTLIWNYWPEMINATYSVLWLPKNW